GASREASDPKFEIGDVAAGRVSQEGDAVGLLAFQRQNALTLAERLLGDLGTGAERAAQAQRPELQARRITKDLIVHGARETTIVKLSHTGENGKFLAGVRHLLSSR